MSRRQLIVLGKVVLVLAFAVLLQILLISRVSVLGVTADLFLILTVIVAVKGVPRPSCFFAGLVADIVYYEPGRPSSTC
jgi:hypothetical protein